MKPNGGGYLKSIKAKTCMTKQISISIRENDTFSSDDTFHTRFPNIFVDYPLGQMPTTDMKWKNWNNALFKLWQMQLNFAVF